MDKYRFKVALENTNSLIEKDLSIGVLKEKTIHAILKNYYSSDICFQEIKVQNFVADVLENDSIYEIQTRNFDKLRSKIVEFTKAYQLYVVYPVIAKSYITKVNPDFTLQKKRLSPKRGSIYSIIPELYKISFLLDNPNLNFIMPFLEVDSFKYATKASYGKSVKIDSFPTELVDEIYLNSKNDFLMFLPADLEEEFTSEDLKNKAKINIKIAQLTILVLRKLGIITVCGKKGRYISYRIVSQTDSLLDENFDDDCVFF